MKFQDLIKSPLNYTGGKFKLLPQILPLFPKDVDCFYDVFCGGANISVNFNANKIIALDINSKVIELYSYFKSKKYSELLDNINNIINFYGLSNTKQQGYDYYNCNSSKGLGDFNKNIYSKIKKDYNDQKSTIVNKNLLFYILIVFGFNNQIRFNKKGEFNISVGKRDFNKNMEMNLEKFHERIRKINIDFLVSEYFDINLDMNKNNFIYADPPYLITTATYNESDGWNDKEESKLLNFLKELDNKKIKFALSNVIEHKNKRNEILVHWINKNKFNIHEINSSYNNSSYQNKDKGNDLITREVLITNY